MPQNIPSVLGGVYTGGRTSLLNITVSQVVKASPGHVHRISFPASGSGGTAWILADCTTLAAATTTNYVLQLTTTQVIALNGNPVVLDWPFLSGITVASVPGAGSPIACVSYD